jgi:hypothetical protein
MMPLSPLERIQILVTGILITSMILLLFYGIFNTTEEESPKFEVVDKYENCDVIRYTDSTQRWNYFLKCNE